MGAGNNEARKYTGNSCTGHYNLLLSALTTLYHVTILSFRLSHEDRPKVKLYADDTIRYLTCGQTPISSHFSVSHDTVIKINKFINE